MQKQITIEQLAGYLPYDLPISEDDGVMEHRPEWIRRYTMTVYTSVPNYTDHIGISWVIAGETFHKRKLMPMLRPLSSLTKEITHNGKSLNVYDELIFMAKKERLSIDISAFTLSMKFNVCEDMPWWAIKVLLKYHFDIHGLIDAGLALPIND